MNQCRDCASIEGSLKYTLILGSEQHDACYCKSLNAFVIGRAMAQECFHRDAFPDEEDLEIDNEICGALWSMLP